MSRTVRSFCRFCVASCGIEVEVEDDRVIAVRGDPDHPVSRGYTCAKGRSLPAFHHGPHRLMAPELRRSGRLVEVAWDDALADLAEVIDEAIIADGPSAVAMYSATAANFDANGRRAAVRLLRGLGSRGLYTTSTIDTVCRPYVSERMSGHPGLSPCLDPDGAALTLLIGINPVISHGHTYGMPDPRGRLRELARGGHLVVVDPRQTETAALADQHLRPDPGTDHYWLAYLVRELLSEGADHAYLDAHARGLDALKDAVAPFDVVVTSRATGLSQDALNGLLHQVRQAGRIGALAGTGLTMSRDAVLAEWLLWALLAVTGSLDRDGGVWFNPGFLRQQDLRSWEPISTLGPGPDSRPELPSVAGELPCAALADEILAGHVRVLLVVGGNPVTALPDRDRLVRALGSLEALAVFDVQRTATTALATHVLPVAGQLERADVPHVIDQFQPAVATQFTHAVIPPPGRARSMWRALGALGDRLGIDALGLGVPAHELDDVTVLRPLLSRARMEADEILAADGGLIAQAKVVGWVRERVLAGGRWDLAPEPLVLRLGRLQADPPQHELLHARSTLLLIPRRQLRQLNSQLQDGTQDGRVERPTAQLHPADAAARGIEDGHQIVVSSATGTWRGECELTETMRVGTISIPHGSGAHNVGVLTSAHRDIDPLTGMVTQTALEVEVRPASA